MSHWIDSHAHLNAKQFADDLDATVERMRAAGVGEVINIGTDLEDSAVVAAMAEQREGFWATVGVHPHNAKGWDASSAEALRALAARPRVVGIGEIGLDYHYDFAPRDVQAEVFAEQLRLADALELPVVIHCREAMADTLAILDAHKDGGYRGVFHCFGGDAEEAGEVLRRGFHVSFTGPVTFKKAEATREAARAVPLERMLVETDCPYLAPVPKRGKRNEPAFVVHTAAKLAELHEQPLERFREQMARNTRALFPRMAAELG